MTGYILVFAVFVGSLILWNSTNDLIHERNALRQELAACRADTMIVRHEVPYGWR